MAENDDGWMLPQAAFDMIEKRIPSGGSIIELGSGDGSTRLMETFNLISIEHNQKWFNTHPGECILAPIQPNIQSALVGELGWYDEIKVRQAFSSEQIDLLLIDGPPGDIGRTGILAFPDLLRKAKAILVDDTHRAPEHSLALSIAAEVQGTITMHKSDQQQFDGTPRSWAWIIPSKLVEPPSPMLYPKTSGILPEKLQLESPQGLGNDHGWISKQVRAEESLWVPLTQISIVIPLYNRKEMLGRTLSALSHQTYPLDLLQIIIADDGSDDHPEEVFSQFKEHFEIIHVRQNDQGYRLSEIRNLGIRAAENDNIILLDCDMAPVPRFVETYARHLSVTTKAVYCGHRRYVDANSIPLSNLTESVSPLLSLPDIETANVQVKGEQSGPTIDWRIPIYQSSDDLRWEKHPFRATCGGNIAFHKSVLEKAGWFDEEFTAWGAEDTEWGFRVWNSGHYIMPLLEACGLHQEPIGGRNETDREAGKAISHPMLIDKCPVVYRGLGHGVGHSVPLVSIYMPAYNAELTIVDAVRSALEQTFEDLEICIVDDGSTDSTFDVLMEHFGNHNRVRIFQTVNRGIGAASNEAVRMCNGVYIGQLDADDLLQPDAVESLLKIIRKETRIGVVYGSYQKIDSSGEFIEDGYVWPDFSREKLLSSMMIHHFRLFRARDWWRTDGFDENLTNAVDYDIFLKLSEITEFKHLNQWTYLYRIHSDSTSISKKSIQDKNNFAVINNALKRRGLDLDWIAVSEDENNPRKVTFSRISPPDKPLRRKPMIAKNQYKIMNKQTQDEKQLSLNNSGIHRIKIGPFNQLDLFLRARRRLKIYRWFWSFYTMAENPGLKPSLSLVSGRLDEERAEKELKRFQKKFKSWKIEIVRTER